MNAIKQPHKSTAQRQLRKFCRSLVKNYELILFVLPAVVIVYLFKYVPIYGIQIAFKNFLPALGIDKSPWVGLKHFNRFFNSYNFTVTIRNTLTLNIFSLICCFPLPVILALLINTLRNGRYKRFVQQVTYMPYFISTVVLVGMFNLLLSPQRGLYGALMNLLGVVSPIDPNTAPAAFRPVFIGTSIWQTTGFNSIIYLAALSAVDPCLHEAAMVDGASRLKRVWYIDLPTLIPTIVILFILDCGSIMNVGFEKAFLLQNKVNISTSEVISTYVYKVGLQSAQYSFSAAVDLFNTVVNFIILMGVNWLSRKASRNSYGL